MRIPPPVILWRRRSCARRSTASSNGCHRAYRAPLILCDLEGQTHEQAAAQLGCPVGTVKSRLSRGREQLRSRLVRRGVAPSAGLLATTLAAESARAVPVELMNLTLGAATRLAAGRAVAAGASSAGAAHLTKGVLRSMLITKIYARHGRPGGGRPRHDRRAGARRIPRRPPERPRTAAAAQAAPAPAKPSDKAPDATPPERGVQRFRLPNGLKIVLRPIKGSASTAMVVVYAIGGDHDPEGLSGLGHTIEHLYVTAAAGDRKAQTAEELFRQHPDGANGQTGDRYTVFATMFPLDDLDRELTDAAARMAGPRVTADDLDRERPRLLQEIENMFEGFATLAAMNNARELVRPTPGGGRHGGRPDQLRAIGLRRHPVPAGAAITSPRMRRSPWPATSTLPPPSRRSRAFRRAAGRRRGPAAAGYGHPEVLRADPPQGRPGRGRRRRAHRLPGLPRAPAG